MGKVGWYVGICVAALALVSEGVLAQSVEEVAEGAKKNGELVQDFRSAIVSQLYRFDKSLGDRPLEQTTVRATWLFDGTKARLDKTRLKKVMWKAGEEMEERVTQKYDDITAFDGETTRLWDKERKKGAFRAGAGLFRESRGPRATHVMLSETLQVGLTADILAAPEVKVVGRQGTGEDAVVVVEVPVNRRDRLSRGLVKAKIEILRQKGCIIGKAEFYDKDGRLGSRYKADKIRKLANGLWLAHAASREYYSYGEDGSTYMHHKSEAVLESFESDPEVAGGVFDDIFPEGAEVLEATL